MYFDTEGRQHLVSLDGEATRLPIGRAHDVAIRITGDSQVSRVHAELELVGEHWVVADEGLSRNGTYLNEARITGRRRLADRDVVRVGLTSIMFREPQALAESSTMLGDNAELAASITPAQRRVLVALCRPVSGETAHATPATNPQIAAELFLPSRRSRRICGACSTPSGSRICPSRRSVNGSWRWRSPAASSPNAIWAEPALPAGLRAGPNHPLGPFARRPYAGRLASATHHRPP